jgi:hypothetical protein
MILRRNIHHLGSVACYRLDSDLWRRRGTDDGRWPMPVSPDDSRNALMTTVVRYTTSKLDR